MKKNKRNRKLLLVGSSKRSVHLKSYFLLIKDYFDEILIVTDSSTDFNKYKVLDFSLKNPIKVLKSIKKLRQIIKGFGPDIIHVHQANSYAYITVHANRGKTPLVLTTWGSDVLILPERNLLLNKMVKFVLNKADFITADASFMIQAIQKLGIKKNVELINFGVNLLDKTDIEKQNIIYSNRLHESLYNIDLILDAFIEFNEIHPNWKLVIGANGSNTALLQEKAKSNLPDNSYEFIGFVDADTNAEYYAKSKIWVSIPMSDGTSISLLEAMGHGCIPVLSDLPANKEWVKDDENGVIVKSNKLCQALLQAIELDLEKAQRINKQLYKTKATKSVNRELYYEIYNKIYKR